MRLWWTVLGLALVLLLPFLLWGGTFMEWLDGGAAIEKLRSFGAWGGIAVIALLIGDLFLPIPATPVMSAAGYLYGIWWGGLFSATGSFLSGMLAYALCRKWGRSIALRLAAPGELERGETLFRKFGGWLVVLSRWLPLLPEVVTCVAGLTRMPPRPFAAALACGSIPMAFVYAAIGAAGHGDPQLALWLSALVPILLWSILQALLRRRR